MQRLHRFFVGRPDNYVHANLPNLMPSIDSDADTLIELFMNKVGLAKSGIQTPKLIRYSDHQSF